MNIIEKVKFLFQLQKFVKEVQMLEKVKAGLAKLDGLKSVLGLLGMVVYYAGPSFGLHVPDVVLHISTGLAGVGLAHKLEKGTGILTKVLGYLTIAKDVADKTQEELNKKEGEGK